MALNDATWIAAVKGLAAGAVNLALGLAGDATLPAAPWLAGALALGFAAYGISLVLFVVGLRHLCTARTGAYFSVAPFFGAAHSVLWLREPLTIALLAAAGLMGLGVWLHLTERHAHAHTTNPSSTRMNTSTTNITGTRIPLAPKHRVTGTCIDTSR